MNERTELLPRDEPERLHPAETFVLTIEAPAGPIPPSQRVKRFLKAAQRSYGLKCLKVAGEKPTLENFSEAEKGRALDKGRGKGFVGPS